MKSKAILGFARAAGKLAVGRSAVRQVVRSGKACLVVLAQDASRGTRREFQLLAEDYGVPVLTLPFTMEELGHAVGMSPLAVVGVTDQHFAMRLQQDS